MNEKIRFSAQKVLKKETNRFLKEIDRFMEEGGVGELLASEKNAKQRILGKSQFKKLMDAAGEASCIEELLLFLSYQKSKKHGWDTKCKDGEEIAKKLADSFIGIQDEIYNMIECETGAGNIEADDERVLRLMIAEKYLGYLYWKASAVSRS